VVGDVEERQATLTQEPEPGVRLPGERRRRQAVQPERLAVVQPRGLLGGVRVDAVVHHDDAAVRGGEPGEERRERGARPGGVGLEQGHEVRGERRRRGRVGRRGDVLGDAEVVELDGAERGLVPAVHTRAGLADLRRGRRVVHGQAPRRELQRQVQELVQVALRRERHRYDGD